jgi:hypothetical protein
LGSAFNWREGEVKKLNKKILITAVILLSAAMLVSPLIGTVVACGEHNEENDHEVNKRLPDGFFAITYWTGGNGSIEVPADWPGNNGIHPSKLRVEAAENQGTYGSGDSISLTAFTDSGGWLPVAYFTTNPEAMPFIKTLFSGLPPASSTNNRLLSKSDLKVESHGNKITAELVTPQTGIGWFTPTLGLTFVTIPAFKVELNKVGGSIHEKSSLPLTGYSKSSNFTINKDDRGFKANGVFTCANWSYSAKPMTDGFITMHGITTYAPPTAPGFAFASLSFGMANVNISYLDWSKTASITGMVINALHIESSTFGSGDALFLILTSPGFPQIPFAFISTIPAFNDFMKTVWSGTGIYRKGLPGPPVVPDLDNTRLVTARELSVRRCGNHIIVDFKPRREMTLLLVASAYYPTNPALWPPFVLPAFHMEFDETGDLVPGSLTQVLSKSLGLSGYTIYQQRMQFSASATFTCPVWNSQGVPTGTTAISITKYGFQTYYPPL